MAAGNEKVRSSQDSSRRKQSKSNYIDSGVEENDPKKLAKEVKRSKHVAVRRARVSPESGGRRAMADGDDGTNRRGSKKNNLRVDTTAVAESAVPRTPANVRGSRDLRSPGVQKTPTASTASKSNVSPALPDFITQTDASGNASTPRSAKAIEGARQIHPTGPKPHLHVDKNGKLNEEDDDGDSNKDLQDTDPCETLLEGLRMMCCCLMPEETTKKLQTGDTQDSSVVEKVDRIRLLGALHPEDTGKKCLVLDLDETLVHSSFRAVPGADFVIPVQIEDIVHFVYVAKRPGVDEFLIEMAKHYEIVIYTASLNKYADPLLDLLDPNRVIRARLFRESCVYYEGNYVKDLSLLDRDLSQSIIIDNSPSSYMFHPENAIDCSSFIDDPRDRELDQMGAFLAGVKDIKDVRGVCHQWRDWPKISVPENQR